MIFLTLWLLTQSLYCRSQHLWAAAGTLFGWTFQAISSSQKSCPCCNLERFFSLTEAASRESAEELERHAGRAVWGDPRGRGPSAGARLPRLPALRRRGQLGQPPAGSLRPRHRLPRLCAQVRETTSATSQLSQTHWDLGGQVTEQGLRVCLVNLSQV